MRRVYQVAAFVILASAVYVMVESRSNINYYTQYGPGPGFFPFWCGVLMALFSIVWFFQVTLRPVEGSAIELVPAGLGSVRVVSVVVGLAIFAVLVGYLGFLLTMLLFLLTMLFALGRQRIPVTVVLSVALSWGMTYLFRSVLDVQLPVSGIEFLSNFGL